MVQEGDHLQWALCPHSSPVLGAPETAPSCISSSPLSVRCSAWHCRCTGAALEGHRATRERLVSFGLLFFFFFLIQKCHLHPAVRILEICSVLFSSCGSVQLMLQLQNPQQPVSLLKATIHESPCPASTSSPGSTLRLPLGPRGSLLITLMGKVLDSNTAAQMRAW